MGEIQMQRYTAILNRAQRNERPLPVTAKELRISTLNFLKNGLIDESEKYFVEGGKEKGRVLAHAAAIIERDLGKLLEHEGLPQVACENYVSAGDKFYSAGENTSSIEMYEEARRLGYNTDELIREAKEKLEKQGRPN